MNKSLKIFFNIFKKPAFFKPSKALSFQTCYFCSENNDKNSKNAASVLENPEIKQQAAQALQESMKTEEQKFKLDNKTFSANIGEHTLTYTLDESIKGTEYGVGGFYVIMFTCEVCQGKSVKSFSKNSYHQGVVLIRCEGCDKIHLIADNLGWFEDKPVNIEDIMKRKNKSMIKITDNAEVANIFSRFMQNKKTIVKE